MSEQYWFSLVLLGFGLLALLGWDSLSVHEDYGWFAYSPESPRMLLIAGSVESPQAGFPARDWPWAVLTAVTLVVTAAWYAWRARRSGGSVRTHVALAVAGGLAVATCHVVADIADSIGASPACPGPTNVTSGRPCTQPLSDAPWFASSPITTRSWRARRHLPGGGSGRTSRLPPAIWTALRPVGPQG